MEKNIGEDSDSECSVNSRDVPMSMYPVRPRKSSRHMIPGMMQQPNQMMMPQPNPAQQQDTYGHQHLQSHTNIHLCLLVSFLGEGEV